MNIGGHLAPDSTNYDPYNSTQQHQHNAHSHIPHNNVPQICIQEPGQPSLQSMQFLQVPNQRSPAAGQLTNGNQSPPDPANQGPAPGQIATPSSIDSLSSSPEQVRSNSHSQITS
jgi:hypothetical protein